MDFSGIVTDTAGRVASQVEYILSLNISPADKKARIARLILAVGLNYHEQTFVAVATVLDSAAISTAGLADANGQANRLADKLVRNYSLGRQTGPLVTEYYNSVLGAAQAEAFDNAVSMERHPTLTRRVIGETCAWCREQEAGSPYTNPTGENFARHDNCDCLIRVSGYNTRNGLVKNFRKGK